MFFSFLPRSDSIKIVAQRQGSPFAAVVPLAALLLAAVLLMSERAGTLLGASGTPPAAGRSEITVEHTQSLTLHVTVAAGKREGIVEVSADGPDTVTMSTPASWERREVRGAAIEESSAAPPAFGVARWALPAAVTLSFRVRDADAEGLSVRNASDTPLLVVAKRVNVVTREVQERSVLVKDEVVPLW